jgi:hypothetical protein
LTFFQTAFENVKTAVNSFFDLHLCSELLNNPFVCDSTPPRRGCLSLVPQCGLAACSFRLDAETSLVEPRDSRTNIEWHSTELKLLRSLILSNVNCAWPTRNLTLHVSHKYL